MVFKPGQSGNPSGSDGGAKHKNKIIADQLLPYAKEFVAKLVALSRSSDEAVSLAAVKDGLNRLYGTPAQTVSVEGGITMAIWKIPESSLTSESWAKTIELSGNPNPDPKRIS